MLLGRPFMWRRMGPNKSWVLEGQCSFQRCASGFRVSPDIHAEIP